MTQVTTYTELIRGIQVQVHAMQLRQEDFEVLAGFPVGLAGKVFGPLQVKRLGPEKLFDALRTAGLRLRLEIDPEQLAHMMKEMKKRLIEPRQANQARAQATSPASSAVLSRVFRPLSKLGGKARWHKTTKQERAEHARNMGIASGKKRRKEMKKRARQRKAAHAARKEAAREIVGA